MKPWQTISSLLLLNYVLWIFIQLISETLSSLALALHAEVLIILFPALLLPLGPALIYCFITAFLVGSYQPISQSATLLSVMMIYIAVVTLRGRLLPLSSSRIGVHAAVLQFLVVMSISAFHSSAAPFVTTFWIRCLSEGLLSALFVGALAGLWCQWQSRLIAELEAPHLST
jgi:hypothetical protein